MAEMAEDSNDLMTTSALLINMQNPKVTDYTDRKVENYKNTNDGFIIEATEKDALQLIGDRDGYNTENFKKEYVVFEPEQIHILGSKQDIEGFKNFVKTAPAPRKVFYSIKTKTTAELAKGINKDLIKSQKEIKYTSFIQALVLNKIGDITPNKVLKVTPAEAFASAKSNFETSLKNVNNFIGFIKTAEKFNTLKEKDPIRFNKILAGYWLQNISSFEEAVEAGANYKEIVDNFKKYETYVIADLLSKGLKISKNKNKIDAIDPQDKEDQNQDDTEDNSLPNIEINPQKFDATIFEVNPYDTATVRVRALIQTIKTGQYEMGIPLYADPSDVMDDMLYAGVSMNLSGFTDKDSKFEKFKQALQEREEGRPYIKELLAKIEKAEEKGDWAIINQILTFASKAFANEELLLYTLRKTGSKINGVTGVKIIGGNRDTIIDQIKRDWISKQQTSNFYNKAANGDLTPKLEKVEELNKIREEGKLATGDAQKKKFIEYFNVLGIEFTMNDLKVIAPKVNKLFRKNFSILFDKNNLLDNIYKSFKNNLNVPFEGQYGFQDEGREMGFLAQLYFDATPNIYKAGSTKTADGKTKYLYIQTNNAEISKREFQNTDGTSVTNTALAQPNSGQNGFWRKVKQNIAKFILGYFNGSREQEAGKEGKVRKNFTEKEQIVNMLLGHQANMKEGSYITFTLSDKTTSMQTKMTKEFFVDDIKIPVGSEGEDYTITKNGEIKYSDAFKNRVYNSFVEPEISRILSSMKYESSVNLKNFNIASKLFYFFPKLNQDASLENFRKDLYSGKFTIEELNAKYSKIVADVVINEFILSTENSIDKFIENGIIEVGKKGNYKFPFYDIGYVNRFREVNTTSKNLAMLMGMDMKLNYMNSQIKTIQFLKFDPMHSFKPFADFKGGDFNTISGEDKVKLANSTWDEFSKRAAALIAPGSQGNWTWKYDGNKKIYGAKQTYRTVTLKDVEKGNQFSNKKFETTDAQEFVTMQEHIDYLMSEGRIPLDVWESIHKKIQKAGPGGYYELSKEELGYVLTPMKPVYAGSSKEGPIEAGLNRFDYVKSSRYPLIPQHEAGSERDKLRIWMEKNNIQSANFASAKKLGKPSLSVEVFDKDNNFIEPVDFEKGLQELSRDGLRNQQEIPHQKDQIATVSQMNRTLFDGLLESRFDFSGLKNVSGKEMKAVKEAIRAKMFDIAAEKLKQRIGDLHRTNEGLYNMLEEIILEDTTGSYTKNDLRSLTLNDQGMFEIPLEVQFKFPKFQGLINSMINKNVMLKVEGTSFVQVSGVGAKFNFKDLSKGVKSDIVWTDKFAKTFKDGEAALKYISKDKQGNVQPAQVIVSQYLRDEKGELIDLKDFITEKNGVKILDTSRFTPEMLQLVASRIPNQSHVSMLPIEVVGFLPSYMENTIVVPDGITGQMGSDFDVDKLFAYTSKIVKGKNKKNEVIYGLVEYSINNVSDVFKLNPDQLIQAYRDIHWNVLTHEDTFDKITKSVDMDEVKDKVALREKQLEKYGISIDKGANLPLDYQTSINRFTDNKSGKDGVSIYANLISAQADMQDKPLTLGKINKKTNEEEPNPVQIKLTKNGKIINLLYIGKTGESKSFIGEKRSISDNLNIQFTESVDNAKNQFLREFGWNDKSMGAMGMLTMLTDEKGQAVPIEFMMDLSSQPAVKKLLNLIDLKQDAFGTFKPDALKESIVELQEIIEKTIDNKRFLPVGDKAGIYLTDSDRDKVLDPQTLADMWLVGKAIEANLDATELEKLAKDLKYDSVYNMLLKYYAVQYDSLELFQRLNGLGKELMTILVSLYTYTKGIGSGVFITKQKLNQLNKLAYSENFIGIKNLAGVVEKNKETGIINITPEGELGSSIENSLIEAQRIYGYLFPIATGKNLESIVTSLLDGLGENLNTISSNRYETVFNNVFSSSIEYLYTHPDLELFEDVRATRERLINGDNSLGIRIIKLKSNPEWAKNGFLKNLQIDPIWNSDIQTILFKAPFGTQIDGDVIENGFYELATYKGENEEEIRSIPKDIMLYVYATGDAGHMGSKIPIDYVMSDKEFARGIRRIRGTYAENINKNDVRQNLIDQIVQNNPDEYSKKFSFFSSNTYESPFKTGLKSVINNADNLSNISTFTISRGDFKGEKAQGIVDSLTIPLNDAEIKQAIEDGLDPYTKDKEGKAIPKAKYPPYILISDTFQGDFYDAEDRNIKYLYKRTSKALNVEGNATYERINILGIKGIKEFDANPENIGLKSVIKNNNTDTMVDPEMYPDEPDMTFGLTPESFEDYSIKPGQGKVIFDIKSSRFTDETGKSVTVTKVPLSENEEEESTYERKPNTIFINNREATIIKKETIDGKLYIDYKFKNVQEQSVSVETAETIYSKLGNKTQSKMVEIPGKGDLADVTYDAKTFWSEVVPEARDQFGDQLIIAYRGKRTNTFAQNYKGRLKGDPAVTIGNPFDWQDETGTRDEQGIKSTKKFIHWMITGDNMGVAEATPEYRQAIIDDIKNGKLKGRPIIYYEEKGYATHATALDYLINKYDWNATPKITTPNPVQTVSKPGPVAVKIFKWNRQSAEIGTDADIAMRKIATGSIVEFKSDKVPSSSLTTMNTVGKDNSYEYVKDRYMGTSYTGIKNGRSNYGDIVMLARNGKLSGTELSPDTIAEINEAHKQGAKFLVGDMEGVDTPFIDYLNKIGAVYAIYGHGRLKGVSDVEKIAPKQLTEEKSNKINIYSTDKNGFQDLSNFAKRPFVVNGITFPTVEHAYQWSKGNYYNTQAIDPSSNETPQDQEAKVRKYMADILAAKTGAEAKAEGRKNIDVEFEKEMWDEKSSDIMKMLIQKSFEQNPEAAAKLLSTGDAELTHTQDNTKWKTEFPKLLMEVREELKSVKPSEDEEPITVDYGGKTYMLEGSEEDGFVVYNTSKGKKSKVVTDANLVNKVNLAHAVSLYPERVVTLTNMQHSPKYLISFEGQVYSLTPSNFGKEIESEDIIRRVYEMFNAKLEDKIVIEEKGPQVGQEKPTFSYKGITVPTEFKLSEQQAKALTDIIDFTENPSSDTGLYTGTYTLEGYAGTGKTSIIGVLERYIKEKNKYTEFIYMAPTHAATVALGLNVVKYGSRYLPMTVASAVREGKDKFGNKTILFTKKFTDRAKGTKNVIVLDEASMLANKDFDKVVTAAQNQGYKVIFLGDPKQIPEVMPGAKTKELAKAFANPSKSILSTVFRTKDNNILNILTNIRNNKEFEEYNFESTDNLKQLPRGEYNDELIKDLQNNLEDVTIINYTNDGVAKINQAARRVLGFDGELKAGEKIMGYLGSQTKQIEKGHIANSVSYMVDKVEKSDKGPVVINAHSKLLENLLQQGMSGFKNNISFTYLQLSNDDSLDFGLNDKQLEYNKNILKEQLKKIHELNNAYLVNKTISYPAYVNSVEEIRKELADINTGAKYIYNPKTDDVELYDSKKHYGLNANLEIDKGVDFGYGITIHKSQGMTIPIVYFDTSSLGAVSDTNITRNGEKFNTEKNALYYVGMSRASQKLVVPINEIKFTSFEDEFSTNDDTGGGIFDLSSFIAENIKQDISETVFGSTSSELTTKDILNNVLKQATPLNKQLLSLVSKTGGVGNLRIVVDEKIKNPGEYDSNTKVIKINPELAISDNVENDKEGVAQLHEVIMHELLHHITTDLLNTNLALLTTEQRKWVTSLKNLFKTTQEKLLKDSKHSAALKEAIDVVSNENGFLSTSDKSKYYGLTSVDEFVSMLMTDEGFRQFMNETSYEGNKSILERFIEILSKILEALGVHVKDNSVLKEGITNIVGLIESRNIIKTSEDSAPLRSISTESAKANLIKENFESIIESLNIKTQC